MEKVGTREAYIVGKSICLRPLCKKDINKRYLSWLNDTEVTRWSVAGTFPYTRKDLEYFYERMRSSKNDIILAVIAKQKNVHIGNVKLGNINWVHRFADFGIIIGEKKYWGKGYGQEACNLLLEYAFNRLNLNKIVLGVYGNHKAAIKVYQKVGFKIEGRLEKMLHLRGAYVDRIIMGLLRENYTKRCSSDA